MIIRRIELENSAPVKVVAELTVEELAWIATRAGGTSGDQVAGDLWDVVTGDLFNRYWEDGLPGYQRGDETS